MSGLLPAMAAAGGGPPAAVFYALAPILLLAIAFDVYCLIDLTRARSVRHLPKWVWAVVIVLISAPWGGLIYLFAGRDRDGAARSCGDRASRHGKGPGQGLRRSGPGRGGPDGARRRDQRPGRVPAAPARRPCCPCPPAMADSSSDQLQAIAPTPAGRRPTPPTKLLPSGRQARGPPLPPRGGLKLVATEASRYWPAGRLPLC